MKLRKSFFLSTSLAVVVGSITVAGGCSSDNNSTDAGSDTGVVDDTGADVKKDTGKADTGGMDAGLMCPTPKSDISGFMAPATAVPPNTPSSACTDVQLASYWLGCRAANSTAMTCTAWRTANPACGKCIESNDTDMKWGVLVYGSGAFIVNGLVQANYDGCLTLLGATQCANDDFASSQCTKFACEEQCPVTDNSSYMQYNTCTTSASSGACKMYSSKIAMSCAGDSGAAVMACRGTNFQDYYNKIAPIFCGGAPAGDAGDGG